jgi:4-hydroxy-4-methyl-2-oxoglutarate aldolase
VHERGRRQVQAGGLVPAGFHGATARHLKIARSKELPLPTSVVYTKVNRVERALCEKALQVSVSDLHEALGGARAHSQTMSHRMRPLLAGVRIAGPAVTACCPPGDNLMMHRALFLSEPGDVLVVQCPESGAQWGDMAAFYAKQKGLGGIVVDGYIRDTDDLLELRSPVWATKIGASTPAKAGHGIVNAPIVCDGVRVEPGDLVVADGDGVVVIPRKEAAAVVDTALQRKLREDAVRQQIVAGAHPWHLHGCDTNYAALQIREIDGAWNAD